MTASESETHARFEEGPSDLTASVAYATEIDTYPSLWRWLSIADMAHVRGLIDAAAINGELGHELLSGLYATHHEPAPKLDPLLGDLYSNRYAHLRARLGSIVDLVHTGRARREATTIAWHLETRSRIESARGALARFVRALLTAATNHATTLMSDFTYLQHAQPTTLGHYLLTFAYPLSRDIHRLTSALERVNRSPAGSGSVNGSRIPIDRRKLAEDLGFDGLVVHTRDAMWAPDIALDPMWATMSAMVTLDRLVEELQIWATAEFSYFEPANQHTRTSVIMPQKKNPYGLAMIRGHARDEVGQLVSVITTNLTPTGQPDNRVKAYGEVPASLLRLEGVAELMAEHLEQGQFDSGSLGRSAGKNFTTATEICDWAAIEHGVSNRDAHAVVGRAVRIAIAREADELEVDDISAAARDLAVEFPALTPDELAQLQDPGLTIHHHVGVGSVTDVERMIEELSQEVNNVPAARFSDFESAYLDSIATIIEERNDA